MVFIDQTPANKLAFEGLSRGRMSRQTLADQGPDRAFGNGITLGPAPDFVQGTPTALAVARVIRHATN
jgi:hypothetical protein